jgi:hypothetical protein
MEVQIKHKGNYVYKHNIYTLLVGDMSTERQATFLNKTTNLGEYVGLGYI